MKEVVIVAAARTALGRAAKGSLANSRPDDLGAAVARALVDRLGPNFDQALIEDVLTGCAFPEGEQGMNMARLIALLAGLPHSVAATTVNRFCGSSMTTTHMAAQAIMSGAGDVFLSLGVESMTKVPMGGFNPIMNPTLIEAKTGAYMGMGLTAENLADKYGISRQEQDEFAARSHQKAAEAWEKGYFKKEVIPFQTLDLANKPITFDKDECIRLSTPEQLATLKPVFKADGSVTAATSSPLTDGAAGLVLMSRDMADQLGIKPLAKIRGMAVAGCDPTIMGIGPVPATKKALARAGVGLADIESIELNEAFAAQSLAVVKELGIDQAKLNRFGGAIAIGHPLGCSGARILTTLLNVLETNGQALGLATMCIGGGQGVATVIERI